MSDVSPAAVSADSDQVVGSAALTAPMMEMMMQATERIAIMIMGMMIIVMVVMEMMIWITMTMKVQTESTVDQLMASKVMMQGVLTAAVTMVLTTTITLAVVWNTYKSKTGS